jgi:D-arabinose 1-dehydrogenase-like Zn-dependent alcohol dehydrogenase
MVAGSATGGMKEIQEMVDFAANIISQQTQNLFQWNM